VRDLRRSAETLDGLGEHQGLDSSGNSGFVGHTLPAFTCILFVHEISKFVAQTVTLNELINRRLR
jgi:hypothetical protein